MAEEKKEEIKIGHEEFVRLFLLSRTYVELAARTGLTVDQCRKRTHRLRNRGVKLPKMITSTGLLEPIDVVRLNKLIDNNNLK